MIVVLLLLFVATCHHVCDALSATPSRRDFLETSIISSTIAVASSPAVATTTSSSSSPLTLPPLGLGAWAWGDSLFWGYDPRKDDELKEVFDYAVSKNAFFDTAEAYGLGRSEELLGKFRNAAQKRREIRS